jgi:hypothetical protein
VKVFRRFLRAGGPFGLLPISTDMPMNPGKFGIDLRGH